jgi:4-coumarate--CoA ligase
MNRIIELSLCLFTFQVAPAELENIMLSHPDVDDCAVVGLPDKLAGELPLAFVVRRSQSSVTEKELQKYVAGESH